MPGIREARIEPVVKNPTHIVQCHNCGFRHDMRVEDGEDAFRKFQMFQHYCGPTVGIEIFKLGG